MTVTEGETGRRNSGVLARLFGSPVFVVVAGVVALALVATTAIVAVQKFVPAASAVQGPATAPTQFALQATAITTPAVNRGGTVTFSVQGMSSSPITRVELWEDDHLWVAIDDPEVQTTVAGDLVDLQIDYVPVIAGSHTILVRAIDSKGLVAQGSPLVTAVLDLPEDLEGNLQPAILLPGYTPDRPLSFRTVQGDTLDSIAGRLGIPVSGIAIGGTAGLDTARVFATGTPLRATLPSPDAVASLLVFPAAQWVAAFTAKVDGCTAKVVSQSTDPLLLYATPTLAQVGTIEPGGSLVLDRLPIGVTTLVGYVPGSRAEGEPNEPSQPVSVTIPDECVFQGWTGTVSLGNNTVLTTFDAVTDPYLYVRYDQGDWQRVPAKEGTFLAASNLMPIGNYLAIPDHYDQVDVEMWSSGDGSAERVGDGKFCLKSVPNVTPAESSGSGGPCMPEGAKPSGNLVQGPSTISLYPNTPGDGGSISIYVGDPDPLVADTVTLSKDIPVTFQVATPNERVTEAIVQFSLIPISSASPSLHPAGVFKTQKVSLLPGKAAAREGTFTISPWQLQYARFIEETSLTTDSGDILALDDELSLSMANAALAAGRNFLDRVYIRVVAAEPADYMQSTDYLPAPLPFASSNTLIDFGLDDDALPLISNPTLTISPGIQQSQSAYGYDGHCHDVQSYPYRDTWNIDPDHGPHWNFGPDMDSYFDGYAAPGDHQVSLGDPTRTDLAWALQQFPDQNAIYCELPSEQDRYFAYMAQADAERDRAAAKCGLSCILSTVLMGAYVGFLAGGPFGALVGASIGLGLGAGAAAIPGLNDILQKFWDAIAAFYNQVMTYGLSLAAALNPLCYVGKVAGSGSATDDKVKDICTSITKAVGAAVVTAVTGLPPQLPLYEAVQAMADGEFTSILVGAMGVALGWVGLSCDTFTLEAQPTLEKVASEAGADPYPLQQLEQSKDPVTGNYSGCQYAAIKLVGSMRQSLERANTIALSIRGNYREIPGLVTRPIIDKSPVVQVRAPGDPVPVEGEVLVCPALVTAWVLRLSLKSSGTYAYHVSKLEPLETVLKKSYTYTDNDPSKPLIGTWSTDVALPILPDLEPSSAVVAEVGGLSTAKDPYLRVEVDSRCFDSVLTISANKYDTDVSAWGVSAYHVDQRPVIVYTPDFFPFS